MFSISIKMRTNKPMFSPVVLEIACGIPPPKKKKVFSFHCDLQLMKFISSIQDVYCIIKWYSSLLAPPFSVTSTYSFVIKVH